MRNYQPHDEPIPGYRLQKPLGQGSFGQVWKALGPGDVEVALKIIRGLDGRYAIREWQSLQNVMNLRQPNLVAVYGVWLKDEAGKVLKKEDILALIPPEPEPSRGPSPERTSVRTSSKPSWAGRQRLSAPVTPESATLAAPELSPPEQQGLLGTGSPATTQGSSPAAGPGSGSAGSGDPGNSASPGSAGSGSGGSGSGGSNALGHALNSAKLPPLELVMAMTLGEGTLMDRLKDGPGPGIPRPELLSYMRDAAKGIQFLNQNDVHHCDIKPENLMIVGGSVQVCDYGSALKAMYNQESRTHQGVTREYAAPEQLTGRKVKMHKSTDQYALAMTYYALRTGQYPWPDDASEPIEVIKHTENFDFSALAGLSPWTFELDVIRRALRKDPKDRFPSLTEFMEELDQAVEREAHAQRDRRRKFWRSVTAAACLLLAIALGAGGWRFREQISGLVRQVSLYDEIKTDLEAEAPSDEAFLAAVPKLDRAIENKRDIADDLDGIQGLLHKKLDARLTTARSTTADDEGAAIKRWLEIYERIPEPFRSEGLIRSRQQALSLRPIPKGINAKLQVYLDAGRFQEALQWSKGERDLADVLEGRIRQAWDTSAQALAEQKNPEEIQALVDLQRAIPQEAADFGLRIERSIGNHLAEAERELDSSAADDWTQAANRFRQVREILATNKAELAKLPNVGVGQLGDKALLGELASELRRNDLLPLFAEWSSLQGRLSDPGDSSPENALRYKLLLASFADKMAPPSTTGSVSALPLIQDNVLVAMDNLSNRETELSTWEKDKLSALQDKLQDILVENRQLAGTPTEDRILQINKGAAFVLALVRAKDALLKASPDLLAARTNIQEAQALAANAKQKPNDKDASRLLVLDLWQRLADPTQWTILEKDETEVKAGLEAFLRGKDSDYAVFEAAFLDVLFAGASGSESLALHFARISKGVDGAQANARLQALVDAQVQVAQLRGQLLQEAPDWKKISDQWQPRIKQYQQYSASPQSPASPFKQTLPLLTAAFLEARTEQEPSGSSPIEDVSRAFKKLTEVLSVDAANVVAVPDRDYLTYVRDLSLSIWPKLESAADAPASRFLMAGSESPLLKTPYRRRLAARWILAEVDATPLPNDDNYVASPTAETMTQAVERLQLAEAWLKDLQAAKELLAIGSRMVRAMANVKQENVDWSGIDKRVHLLLLPEHYDEWRKENCLGQLLFIGTRTCTAPEADSKTQELGVRYCADFITHVEASSGEFTPSPSIPDVNLFTAVIQPGIGLAEAAGIGDSSSKESRHACATLYGQRGKLLARDKAREISRNVLKEEIDSDKPRRMRLDSFAEAARFETDPKRKARWLVEQAKTLRFLHTKATEGDQVKQTMELANASLTLDKEFHGAYAILGYVYVQMARQVMYTDEPTALQILGEAKSNLAKAADMLAKCPPGEVENYSALYLEDRSAACVDTAYIQKVLELGQDEILSSLNDARKNANEVIQSYPDRSDPANAHVCLANALEDFAHHGAVPLNEVNKYFLQAIAQFDEAVRLSSLQDSATQGQAAFNLGRCYLRYGAKGVNLTEAERAAQFDSAVKNLQTAVRLHDLGDLDRAAEARFFLFQVSCSRLQRMLSRPKGEPASVAELQQEFLAAEDQCDAAITSAKNAPEKRNLSLYRHDAIQITHDAAQAFYGRRNDADAIKNARQWRMKLDARGSEFLAITDETLLAAAPKHKFKVLKLLLNSKRWELPVNPLPAERDSVARQQFVLVKTWLPQFPRGRSDAYRVILLKKIVDGSPKDQKPGWFTELKETAEASGILSARDRAGAIAFVDARTGILKIDGAKTDTKKNLQSYREGMNSLTSAIRSLRSVMDDDEPPTSDIFLDYKDYLSSCIRDTLEYPELNETKAERIVLLRWLISEFDALKPNDAFVISHYDDRGKLKKQLDTLEK